MKEESEFEEKGNGKGEEEESYFVSAQNVSYFEFLREGWRRVERKKRKRKEMPFRANHNKGAIVDTRYIYALGQRAKHEGVTSGYYKQKGHQH